MSESVRWIDSTSWELPFFGLPQHLPWPAEVDAAEANREPFEVDHLLHAIELLGPEATEPWTSFLAAAEHFSELIEALQENEIGPALAALDAIDRMLPGTSFVLFHRAYIARREGSDEEAIRLYRLAAEKTPQVAAIWNNLGILHALSGQRTEAIAAYRRALEAQPNDPPALEGLASLRELVKLKSNDPAQPNAVRFVDLPTFHQMALKQIASMTDAEQLFTYGEQLLRDGTAVAAATQALERSAELRPALPRTMHALAAAYRAQGRLDQARDTLSRYVQMYPQDPNGYLHLAQTCSADRMNPPSWRPWRKRSASIPTCSRRSPRAFASAPASTIPHAKTRSRVWRGAAVLDGPSARRHSGARARGLPGFAPPRGARLRAECGGRRSAAPFRFLARRDEGSGGGWPA